MSFAPSLHGGWTAPLRGGPRIASPLRGARTPVASPLHGGRTPVASPLHGGRTPTTLPRRRLVGLGSAALLAVGCAALLSGCGFQPVYMPTASGRPGPAERSLAAVHVNVIADRPGQLLRQALQERFGSDAGTTPERYHLAVGFGISGEGIGITTADVATRIRLLAVANWELHADDATQTMITKGTARYMDAFDTLDQQYFASDLDSEAVQRRMASQIADRITMQLAVYFRRQAALAAR